jgi:large subunit ribosomal protein L24
MGIKQKQAPPPKRISLRKNDTVKVITGRDKGKTGRIVSIDRKRGTLIVEGVMLVKRHTRPNPSKAIKGGIAERESRIHISNVMILASDGKPTRISRRTEGEGASARRVRVSRRTGEPLEAGTR